jgi:hypothetical protein
VYAKLSLVVYGLGVGVRENTRRRVVEGGGAGV